MIGTSIGKYRIVDRLGAGAMGTVLKAVDETLGREVAIKILNPQLATPEVMRRFQTEAATLARLNHPEIATIYELFQSDAEIVMVMELVRGETLDRLLDRSGDLPLERAIYLLDRILSALEHAHASAIVHRDIKPANVMVTDSGGVKIMDFGIAFARGADGTSAAGGMAGTPAYMPPEQVLGRDVDGRADLYAVGVIFYRMLTGTLPFKAETTVATLQKQLSDLPAPLRQQRRDLPEWCETVVRRALAKAPSDRFQSATEFRVALRNGAGAASPERTVVLSQADLEGLGLKVPAPPAAAPAARSTVVVRRPWGKPTAAAVGIVAIGVAALAYAVRPRLDRAKDADAGAPVPVAPPQPMLSAPAVAPSWDSVVRQPPATPPPVVSRRAKNKPAAAPPTVPSPPAVPPSADEPRVATPSHTPAEIKAAGVATVFPPLVFDAKVLTGDGERQRERAVNVQLADGKLTVTGAAFPNDVVHEQLYEAIASVDYSKSPHPLRSSPEGPVPAKRVGRLLGIFQRSRNWVTLRVKSEADPLIVLRLENDAQVKRVIAALEERTRQTATLVVQPRNAE